MKKDYFSQEAADLCATLTEREREVLVLSSTGLRSKQVGDLIGKNFKTVEKYRALIMEKLNVETTIEAAVVAAKAGLV